MQLQQQPEQAAPADLLTVNQFSEKFPAWSPASLRNLVLNAEDRLNSRNEKIHGNGLAQAGAIYRVGSRVLLSPSKFFYWVAQLQHQRRRAA